MSEAAAQLAFLELPWRSVLTKNVKKHVDIHAPTASSSELLPHYWLTW